MIIPAFKIQIVEINSGEVVVSRFGGSALERLLAPAIVEELQGKHIGFFASRATVEAAVSSAVEDVCKNLRQQTQGVGLS